MDNVKALLDKAAGDWRGPPVDTVISSLRRREARRRRGVAALAVLTVLVPIVMALVAAQIGHEALSGPDLPAAHSTTSWGVTDKVDSPAANPTVGSEPGMPALAALVAAHPEAVVGLSFEADGTVAVVLGRGADRSLWTDRIRAVQAP